jgi:eukaryotic-like serine/threonine-protein kinase
MIGEILNNYRVVSLLGEGGMGSVYLAEHPFMGRKAAIKVLRREFAEDLGLVERFMNEARAANAIRHPNIIDIIDVGRMPSGIPYLMMEFLDGVSLAGRIAQTGRLEVTHAVDIMVQATSALTAAHAKGIVHRDLKPDNLYLCPDDSAPGGERVKVLDFGIAKLRGELGSNSAKTQTGSVMGTPPYMSPEQCRGFTDEVDHRTDIYALGIILYEMLCGAPPFVSEGWGDVVLAHMTQEPAPPRSRNPAVPEAVERVILKALSKRAEDRFVSTAEMRGALLPFSSATTLRPRMTVDTIASPPSPGRPSTFREATGEMAAATDPSAADPARRSRRRAMLLGGGALVAAGAIIALVVGRGGRPDAHTVAAPAPSLAAPTAPTPGITALSSAPPTIAPALAPKPVAVAAPAPHPAPPPSQEGPPVAPSHQVVVHHRPTHAPPPAGPSRAGKPVAAKGETAPAVASPPSAPAPPKKIEKW